MKWHRVTIVQRVLAHYRVPFFEALRARLAADQIELRLVYGQPEREEATKDDGADLSWAHHIHNTYVKVGDRALCWQPCLRETRHSDLVIVEQASRLVVNYLLLASGSMGTSRVAFWGHGANLNPARASRLGEGVKRHLARHVDWWFAYTNETAKIVEALGMPRSQITVVQNAVDTSALRTRRSTLGSEDLLKTRRLLGVGDGPVGVALGSLYPTRRPEFLIESADWTRAALGDFHLIVIGSGPSLPILEMAARSRPWLHIMGAMVGPEMVGVAAVGDVMLSPGVVGLNVLDSFALGLPMVTIDLPGHGPEIEYLVEGVNGVSLPTATTTAQFGGRVAELLKDREELDRLRAGCQVSALRYTIEDMTERFASGISQALGHNSRTSQDRDPGVDAQ